MKKKDFERWPKWGSVRRKAERKRKREDSRDPCIGGEGGGSGSDPDEFFRRFPGDFLFFPVVTSGAVGRSLQTIRSKIFTASQPPHPLTPVATRAAAGTRGGRGTEGDPDARNGRGLLAETHKPIPSALHNLLEPRPGKYFTPCRRLSPIGTLSLFPPSDWFETGLLGGGGGYLRLLLPLSFPRFVSFSSTRPLFSSFSSFFFFFSFFCGIYVDWRLTRC